MWTLCDSSEDRFVFKELGDLTCFEYCSTFIDENGIECIVPDSMYKEFIEKHTVMIFKEDKNE